MWNLKYVTNEPIYKSETETTDIENRLVVARLEGGRKRDELGVWGYYMQTITFKMDKQQGPTVQHRELYPISWDKL